MDAPQRAVVLLSGGLDSAVALAIAHQRGRVCAAVTFDYAQRHRVELAAAARVAAHAGVDRHVVVPIGLRAIGGSALTADVAVPKDRDQSELARAARGQEIPMTYVPARNLIFLSVACALAETIDAREVYIGVNAVDYSGYPDCRPEFIEAFQRAVNLGTRAGVEHAGGPAIEVVTPLAGMTKADIVRAGLRLGVDFSLTLSCYDPAPGGAPCGRCDACALRARGFQEAGTPDPAAPGG